MQHLRQVRAEQEVERERDRERLRELEERERERELEARCDGQKEQQKEGGQDGLAEELELVKRELFYSVAMSIKVFIPFGFKRIEYSHILFSSTLL